MVNVTDVIVCVRMSFSVRDTSPKTPFCRVLAQCCALIVKDELATHLPLYSGMNNVKFKNVVRPGDVCEVTARLVARRGPLVHCEAMLCVEGRLCSRGELSFALVKK